MPETFHGYRIKLTIARETTGGIATRNEILLPYVYQHLRDVRRALLRDIRFRLENTMYFRSQKRGYDLVRYNHEASSNTYIGYRVVPLKAEHFFEFSDDGKGEHSHWKSKQLLKEIPESGDVAGDPYF